jgi:hypothetical protein
MSNEFENIMSAYSDEELYDILKNHREDYQPLAVVAAEEELAKRGLHLEQIESELQAEEEKAAADCNMGVHQWVGNQCSHCGVLRDETEFASQRENTFYVGFDKETGEPLEVEATEEDADTEFSDELSEKETLANTEETEIPNPYKVSTDPIFPEIREYKENTEETSTEEITEDVPEEESTENETETDMAVDIGSVLESAFHKRPTDEGVYDTKRVWSFAKGIKPAIGVAVGAFIFLQLFPAAEMKFNVAELTVFFSIIFILVLIFTGFKRAKILPGKTTVADTKQETEIKVMKATAEQNPGDAESWYQLGWAYEEAGRTDEAIATYQKVVTLKSDYGEVWGMLGYNYFLKSDLQRAKEALNKAISLGEKGSVYLNSGHVHLVDYNEAKAMDHYQMGLKTYPSPEEFFGDFDADYTLLAPYGISKERYAKIRQQLQDLSLA